MKIPLLIFSIFSASFCIAQIPIQISIDAESPTTAISSYIYGINGGFYPNCPARRQGGNRMTAYNWENNASNAGQDWFHQSDDFLTWIMDPPPANDNEPGLVITRFHDENIANGAYSMITIPMAGYVARDKNGPVDETETAPSARWAEVVNTKPTPFSIIPDTSDNVVYTDELLNFLINRYGNSSSAAGISAYSLDNEPALWTSTHPLLREDIMNNPWWNPVSVQELIDRTVALATTIKTMDNEAEVFGPALYGFNAFTTLQDAPDWNNFSEEYPRFIDAYLDAMQEASANSGQRLLDVLDVHWYPDGTLTGVYDGDTSRTVAELRMQLPRSLWDSSYVEPSWIGTWFSPVAIIHSLKNSIENYYPGTKLAITEYNYGAADHISGGIAQTDALGIFGKYGVYFTSKWAATDQYIQSAFEIYRNYDGNFGEFGDISIFANTDNNEYSSVYASTESGDNSKLHIIIINKNYDESLDANILINSSLIYNDPEIWYFGRSDFLIRQQPDVPDILNNQISLEIPPLSVYHLILTGSQITSFENLIIPGQPGTFSIHCPTGESYCLAINAHPIQKILEIRILDMAGREVFSIVNHGGKDKLYFDISKLNKGIYLAEAIFSAHKEVQKIIRW